MLCLCSHKDIRMNEERDEIYVWAGQLKHGSEKEISTQKELKLKISVGKGKQIHIKVIFFIHDERRAM